MQFQHFFCLLPILTFPNTWKLLSNLTSNKNNHDFFHYLPRKKQNLLYLMNIFENTLTAFHLFNLIISRRQYLCDMMTFSLVEKIKFKMFYQYFFMSWNFFYIYEGLHDKVTLLILLMYCSYGTLPCRRPNINQINQFFM